MALVPPDAGKVPACVGIIMDGNRRWAKARGLPAVMGHREGGKTLTKLLSWAKEAQVEHLILYTFSTENWSRPTDEIESLLNLIIEYLDTELEGFKKEGGVLRFIGDLSRFSPQLQAKLKGSEESTAGNRGLRVYFALNYGGRQDILQAVRAIAATDTRSDQITESYFAEHLQTSGIPDPELIIRTSGEMRLSGFLPWQSVYSELCFTKTLWPDFSKEEFFAMLRAFGERKRRHGS